MRQLNFCTMTSLNDVIVLIRLGGFFSAVKRSKFSVIVSKVYLGFNINSGGHALFYIWSKLFILNVK